MPLSRIPYTIYCLIKQQSIFSTLNFFLIFKKFFDVSYSCVLSNLIVKAYLRLT
jgi:hypothetical protein